MFCTNCGSLCAEDNSFCPQCGRATHAAKSDLATATRQRDPQNRQVSLLKFIIISLSVLIVAAIAVLGRHRPEALLPRSQPPIAALQGKKDPFKGVNWSRQFQSLPTMDPQEYDPTGCPGRHVEYGQVQGCPDPPASSGRFGEDDTWYAVLNVESGGSGGDSGELVFKYTADGPIVISGLSGLGSGVVPSQPGDRGFTIAQPKQTDPDCCPTSYRLTTYVIRSDHPVELNSWTMSSAEFQKKYWRRDMQPTPNPTVGGP
jgi:hypothetical protein